MSIAANTAGLPGKIAAIIILLIAAFIILARTPSVAADTPDTFQVPAIQVAKALMQARKWSEARDILQRLKPGDEQEKIEVLFLLGVSESRLGLNESAAKRFEEILTRHPDLTRVRLELAQVYHALGREKEAKIHFRTSLADRLPTSVRNAVESYLDHIDSRKLWSASFSVSVLSDSNPAKLTDDQEIEIGGVPFQLNNESRGASGKGLFISTGIQYSPVIGEDMRGVVAGSAAGKFYRNKNFNDFTLQSDLGVARLFEGGETAGGIRYSQRWLATERYSTGFGPWARTRFRLSPKLEANLALSVVRFKHPARADMDGQTVRLRTSLDYAFSGQTSTRYEIEFAKNNAREKRHAHRIYGLALSLSHTFEGGLSVSPRMSVQRRRHVGENPLFQRIRSDRLVLLSVNLLHRRLQFRGFAPKIGYSYEVNRSNIPINEYSNHGVIFGFSRTF